MIDAITYCSDVPALAAELEAIGAPVAYVEDGNVRWNISKAPIKRNGNESLAIVRVSSLEDITFLNTIQILASSPVIKGQPEAVYDVLFADEAATAIYDRVYDQSPITAIEEDGSETVIQPPRMFRFIE